VGGEHERGPVPDPWERYRQLIWDEHMAYRSGFPERARGRPFDPGVRAEAAVLSERLMALTSRIRAGTGDEDLAREVGQLLRDHQALRDQRCAPGSRDWEDLQRWCANLMMNLANIATRRGRAGEARDWFTGAAAAWQDLGDQAWADECQLTAAEASLADGSAPETVLETLDSCIAASPPPVRRARLLARTARIRLDAGDHATARQRADQAADALNAAGLTDPVAAGSVEAAFAAWISAGHREIVPALPWLQVQALFSLVARVWDTLTEMRFPLGTLPRAEALRFVTDLHTLGQRLMSEASDVGRRVQEAAVRTPGARPSVTPAADDASRNPRSYDHEIDLQRRLNILHEEAERTAPGHPDMDLLLDRMARLESEAVQAGDALTAGYAAIERASTLARADRASEAAAVLETARNRLGDGDGLDTARRRALRVVIMSRAATMAGLGQQFPRLSQLCGDAIAEFEQDRGQVSEPYLQDGYLRDRVALYQLGVFAAWKLDDQELALVRADLAKARGSLGWMAQADAPAGALQPSEIAALRSEWSQLAPVRGDPGVVAHRQAVWTRLVTAQARARRVIPPGLDLRAVQAALAPDEAIIYYFFVASETLLIFTITSSAIGNERRVLRGIRGELDRFADGIAALGTEGTGGDTGWLDHDVPRLGTHLLPRDHANLLNHARRLLICPHRILHNLPFHAMDWEQAPLIERFAVSYVPNITSLLITRPASPTSDVLSVGIRSYPPPLAELPAAEREAHDIAAIYRQAGARATVLAGADATRTGLERLRADGDLERFAVIHVATHGEDHPDEEPNAAALYLADGPVDAMEISQWTLNADLVTLSACWSGRRPAHVRRFKTGSPEPGIGAEHEELFGDEIYGLQAAIFASGARQILGSMWPLSDSLGRAVMKSFHASLSTAQAPELALQAAVNRRRRSGLPVFYWAPYKLITLGRPGTGAS